MKLRHHFQTVILMVLLVACSVSKNTGETETNLTQSNKGPLSPQTEQLDFNSIIAEGSIKTSDGKSFFVVDKVLKRGRSAPNVLSNQRLELTSIHPAITPLNTRIKGVLRCDTPKAYANCKWNFKLTQ